MERYCSTGQSPRWAVAPMEEEEELTEIKKKFNMLTSVAYTMMSLKSTHLIISAECVQMA